MDLSWIEEVEDEEDEQPPVQFFPPQGMSVWPSVGRWGMREWTQFLSEHARTFNSGWTDERIAQYLQRDRYAYGVGFRRGERDPLTWFYLPNPAAVPLHASRAPNVLYGGARGGSKSHATRWDAYRHCFAIPGYRSLILRRTREELKDSHMDKAIGECARINEWFGYEAMHMIKDEHEIVWPKTGSKIKFGHAQHPGDEDKYLSAEYDDVRPDEVATFLKSQITNIAGSIRTSKEGIRARFIGTTNPGGAHTQYLKQWFMDKNVPPTENKMYRPEEYQYIPARLYDNPWLMDPDGTFQSYEARLYVLSPQRRRQLLNGDWNALEGQYFPELDMTENGPNSHVQRFAIPAGCTIERWIDWGYDPNPGVCHWVACLPNGRLYVFAEWVFRRTIAADVAKRIKRITEEVVLPATRGKLGKSVCDPSMLGGAGMTGESYVETFNRMGVSVQPGDNERVLGWGRLRHWYGRHPEGGRWMMYHPDCTYAIRTIPSLVHDKNDPDDLDTEGEDHAADADRYGVMGRPMPSRMVLAELPPPKDSMADIIQKLTQSQHTTRPFGQVVRAGRH